MVGRIAVNRHRVEGVLVNQLRQGDILAGALIRLKGDAELAICHIHSTFGIILIIVTIIAIGGLGACPSDILTAASDGKAEMAL